MLPERPRHLHTLGTIMTYVAFLQNMWVKDPARVRLMIEHHGEEYRLRVMKYFLFAGCLTGRRLRAAFGDLCEEIVWEQSTREIADNPKTIFPAQPEHIKAVLEHHKPDAVLTFGRIARDAVSPLWKGILIACPHPAARQPDTMAKLKAAAADLQKVGRPLKL